MEADTVARKVADETDRWHREGVYRLFREVPDKTLAKECARDIRFEKKTSR
jgi:hypothetical protein